MKPILDRIAPLALALIALTASAAAPFKTISDPATLAVIDEVLEQTEALRGLDFEGDLKCAYLDSATLKNLVEEALDKQFPESQRQAVIAFLRSLRMIPEDLDILDLYLSLLDEQVAGLYDHDSKTLFVRRRMDLEKSPLARMILAHEICHALQDRHYGIVEMGIEAKQDDDRAMAVLTVLEGDAMLLMSAYSLAHATPDLLENIAQLMSVDQEKLKNAPHFFKQQMLFPYIQGQALLTAAMHRGAQAREQLFTDPPTTTEQVIHPDKYFQDRDLPQTLALAGQAPNDAIELPRPPKGFERRDRNRMGELGVRLLFEERLGAGLAHRAAAGWDGDMFDLYAGPQGRWWFVWESAWDSPQDAREFADLFLVYWRAQSDQSDLGQLGSPAQAFHVGPWRFQLQRLESRVLINWTDRQP